MEHVVFYPSHEGGSGFKRVGSLDDAVSFVEHLRNSENITEFSVHSLTSVPLSFRAYYHVEVPAEPVLTAVAEPRTEPAVPAAEQPEPAPITVAGAVELPVQTEPLASGVTEEATKAPIEASDEDRSEAWVAEAAIVEASVETPTVAPLDAPATTAGPFAEAPPVTPQSTDDVVPVPTGKRSMGFFAR